jgi:hypothetical protein
MPGDFHYNRFRNTRFSHVSVEGVSQVVEYEAILFETSIDDSRLLAGIFEAGSNVTDRLPLVQKHVVVMDCAGNGFKDLEKLVINGDLPRFLVFGVCSLKPDKSLFPMVTKFSWIWRSSQAC